MLFNSIDFAIFLPIVFVLYWFVFNRSIKPQNFLIAISSYIFYGWWDWRFLSLILFSSLVDFFIGIKLAKVEKPTHRKILLWTSLLVNLGLLGFFKYYNFFLDNITSAFSFFGEELSVRSLNIILPVGISFYTFQTLSYTIDIYNRKLNPTTNFISFTAFVSFFPQLVAGPIERASNLLPQFHKKRKFDYAQAVDGMRQILWGLFKKIVIADNCAIYSDTIFNNSADYGGSTLVLGAVLFAFQIYGDFSGYSDIAIGTARLFGFDLMRNFAFPYFSRDIAEFWRRWHISLSTWFRDYLYIPLGGSRGGVWMKVRNTMIIFIVSGFWHGANWTFIVWGALNALYFLPILLANKNRTYIDTVAPNRILPSFKETVQMLSTFGLTVFAWIFFRAENLQHAMEYIAGIFSKSIISIPYIFEEGTNSIIFPKKIILLVLIFLLIEWLGRHRQYALVHLVEGKKIYWRYGVYWGLIFLIFFFQVEAKQFLYFQF